MCAFINQVDKIFNFSNPHPPHQQNNMETQIWSNCTVDRALKYCPLLYMEKMVWIRMQTLWRSWIPRECKRIKRIPKSSKKSKIQCLAFLSVPQRSSECFLAFLSASQCSLAFLRLFISAPQHSLMFLRVPQHSLMFFSIPYCFLVFL